MQIPTQYQKRVFKKSMDYVGRHTCGWITDRCFAVKTSFKPCYRKLVLAEKQAPLVWFECLAEKVGVLLEVDKVVFNTLVFEKREAPVAVLRVGNKMITVDKVYYDYFTQEGCTFKIDVELDYRKPIVIFKDDKVVGYLMGLSI